jgi:DNA-binding response OmpR family regulator
MSKHILSVSYDDRLLIERRTLLEQQGYRVTSALGFNEAFAVCNGSVFDLVILGNSIPYTDKKKLIENLRNSSATPVLSLWQHDGRVVDTAHYLGFSDNPAELLKSVATILAKGDPAHIGQ